MGTNILITQSRIFKWIKKKVIKNATKQNIFSWNFELNGALLIFFKFILNGFHKRSISTYRFEHITNQMTFKVSWIYFLIDQNIIFCSKENETIVLDAKIFLKIIN
jgi:hypothetical protein